MTGRSSARGQGRRWLSGRSAMFQWAAGLDVAGGGFETGGAFIKVAVDVDVAEFSALKAGLMVTGVVTS